MSITDNDVRRQVEAALGPEGTPEREGINVDGVVREIVDRFGLVDIDSIDADEFWGIVAAHDVTQS
jgi:hypothetical protein